VSDRRLTRAVGDYTRGFSTEDGKHFRSETQELGPAIRRVELIKQAQMATQKSALDKRYVGSVPITVIHDWLMKHGYKWEEYARNEGGEPYATNPRGGGVRDKFMKYFLSRDFSKLHTQHTTTRRESSQIVVPNYIGAKKHEDTTGTP
jgi:hypothetical protein